jgi:L-histidine Nalpha-methyltransferase
VSPHAQPLGGTDTVRTRGSAADESLLHDALAGLAARPKTLPPKHFYDAVGARLFERICELEEYYPTRTEVGILKRHIDEIVTALGPGCRLVEFGSGSGLKTQILLRHLRQPSAYVPVDISRAQLLSFAESVRRRHPSLDVRPVCADYTRAWSLPPAPRSARRTVAFFPGSTIGNLEKPDAEQFLRRARTLCGSNGGLLVGVDLKKDRSVVERAYNDAAGVTAAFNLNLLHRLNRECDADFDVDAFAHYAPYDEANGRIEMRLVSRVAQEVGIGRGAHGEPLLRACFAAGEYIVTEYSHKYAPAEFAVLAGRSGWRVDDFWTDDLGWFGVFLLGR